MRISSIMKLTHAYALLIGLSFLSGNTFAEGPTANLSARTLQRWAASPHHAITVDKTVGSPTVTPFGKAEARPQTETLPFSLPGSISAVAISGSIQLEGKHSLVRVILIDDQSNEHLVYEAYPLITPDLTTEHGFASMSAACRETCLLTNVHPRTLRVELISASITIKTVDIIPWSVAVGNPAELAGKRKQIHAAQEREIVDVLNGQLTTAGLKWVAGMTPISELTYAEKKSFFRGPTLPNLQGFEYYKRGIFEISSAADAASPLSTASSFVPAFDWRARHRANDPTSPYYNGDPYGSGWMTPVKTQLCGDCWAHAATGAIEAGVNLYFNRHLDLDLSEQQLVSCTELGRCGGGISGWAFAYAIHTGLVDEACFPETGRDDPCGNMCTSPRESILIDGYEDFFPSDDGADKIKQTLISQGPFAFTINSWSHSMVLVGYNTDESSGVPIWIIKNSWGVGWGERGYASLEVDLSDIGGMSDILSPYVSQLKQYDIACRDEDHDGYYNWGLSPEKPVTCGPDVPPINDCNDADPNVALQKPDGSCVAACKGPTIKSIIANPNVLWPPNGQMIPVSLGVNTSGGCGAVSCKVQSVKSNEAINGSDWTITGNLAVNLRAARLGTGTGRVYTVGVQCTDQSNNTSNGTTGITVPHDIGLH